MCFIYFLVCFLCGENAFDSLHVNNQCNGKFCIPRIIWSHWNGDILPPDIEEMVKVTRSSSSNFSFVFLTPQNISNFVDLSNPPPGYYRVHLAGQCDWIRVSVLEKYGGFYVDSTMYMTSGSAVEWVFWNALKEKRSVFGFEKRGVKCLVEMSVVGASVNSVFMKAYKEDYGVVLQQNNMSHYVNETCAEFKKDNKFPIDVECGSEYFLVHHIFLKTCYTNRSLSEDIIMMPWDRGQFSLLLECEMKATCFNERLLYDADARSYPFIKVTSAVRNGRRYHLKEEGYDPTIARKEFIKNDRCKRIYVELDFWLKEIQFRLENFEKLLKDLKNARDDLQSYKKKDS